MNNKKRFEFTKDFAYDGYFYDEYKNLTWKEGKGYEGSPFKYKTFVDVFLCSMALGFHRKIRSKFKEKRIPFETDAVVRRGGNLILSVAIAETKTLEILYNINELYNIVEEYSNGGLPELISIIDSTNNIGTPLVRMEEIIFKEIELIEVKKRESTHPSIVTVDEEKKKSPLTTLSPFEMIENLELSLRKLIDKKLSEINSDWQTQRIPPQVLENWRNMAKAELNIVPPPPSKPLISYSHLGELRDIILRGDNWREKFKAIFRNEEFFKGSMSSLIPIRNQVMHAGSNMLNDLQKQTLKTYYDNLMNLINKA